MALLSIVISSLIFLMQLSSASFASNSINGVDPSSCMTTTDNIQNVAWDNQTLRVVVPWKVGFEQFVQFNPDSCILDGFSIQVFLQALRRMGRDAPRFEFVLHGNGHETPLYEDLVNLTANGTVDMVVADLTITRDRMERVGFTQPYLASTLVMVTPFRYGSAGALWDFLKPFSWQLWITLFGSFVATGIALYLLENTNPDFNMTTQPKYKRTLKHPGDPLDVTNHISSTVPSSCNVVQPTTNEVFSVGASLPPTAYVIIPPQVPSSLQRQGPPIYDEASHRHRIMNAYWFTSLCIFAAQQDSVRTHMGRLVTVIWLFVMLIFNSSYTASLASLLSAQKIYPTIKNFEVFKKDVNITAGYQQGSFMHDFLMNNLNLSEHRLLNFTSELEFAQALRDGKNFSTSGGVGAVLDESPYILRFLQSECEFTMIYDVLNLPAFGGLGFAFATNSPWIDKFSESILAMEEDGTLQVLQNGWRIVGQDSTSRCSDEPSHLRLRSFGGLFSMLGVVYLVSVICRFLTKAAHSEEGISSCAPIPNVLMCAATQNGSIIQPGRQMSNLGPLGRPSSNRVGDEYHLEHESSSY